MPRPAACAYALAQLPPIPGGGAEMYPTICFKAAKVNAKGVAPLVLRLTIAGQRADYSTGFRITREQWDAKRGRVKDSHPAHITLNDELQKLLGAAVTAKQRVEASAVRVGGRAPGSNATAAEVAEYLRDPTHLLQAAMPPCFLAFCEQELDAYYSRRNAGTYKSIQQAVRSLRAFHGPGALYLADFTPQHAARFYDYLLTNTRAHSASTARATAGQKLRWLIALFNRGRKQNKAFGLTNPFADITKEPAGRKAPKARLSAEQVRQLAAAPLRSGSRRDLARCVFLLQFYLRGERIGATLLLRRLSYNAATGLLRWQAQKRGPYKEAIIPAEARALLARLPQRQGSPFLLPILPADYDRLSAEKQLARITYSNRRLNESLDELSQQLGFDVKLRTHTARHTFATLADRATGHNARAVQQMLGHSKLATTEVYLADLTSQELQDLQNQVYGSLLGPPPEDQKAA